MMRFLKRLHHPVTYIVLLIILAEWWLPGQLYQPLSSDEFYARNPYFRRNWDEYIRVTSRHRDPEFRILLISNSQGVGLEYPEEQIYTTLLQKYLNHATNGGPKARLINWSIVGLQAPELVMLLARAQELEPHLILCILGPTAFKEKSYIYDGKPTPISMFPSDVLAPVWFYRDRLPESFRKHYIKNIHFVSGLFYQYWPGYRLKDLPLAKLLQQARFLVPFVPPTQRFTWLARPLKRQRLKKPKKKNFAEMPPHPELLRMTREVSEPLQARKIFILQPHGFVVAHGEQEFAKAMKDSLQAANWEFWDMSSAVPWQEFLKDAAHFTEAGHRIFADSLAVRLDPIIKNGDFTHRLAKVER